MIILSLLIDYFMTCLLPIKTYFIVWELDKNKLASVIIAGIFLDEGTYYCKVDKWHLKLLKNQIIIFICSIKSRAYK